MRQGFSYEFHKLSVISPYYPDKKNTHMNEEQKKIYIAWLNDAHALEENLISVLEKQIADAEAMPEMKDKLQEHLEQTRRHAQLVRSCLTRHGEEPSGGKDMLAKVSAAFAGMSTSMTEDTAVKNVHSGYAAEQMEIASYTVIRAAASELGDMETITACDEILADENEMAQWLLTQIPEVTSAHLQQKI
jgi:ferritin-like metal-binding protein YciE